MKKGFSLLELLVVTAIISLLAALLFPVFARAKREACRTQCLSNLRQLGLAVQMYQDDSNGMLPVGEILSWQNTMGDGSKGKVQSTRDLLKPLLRYTHSDAVMTCPENDEGFTARWIQSFSPVLDQTRVMVPEPGLVLARCMHHLDVGWTGRPGFQSIQPATERRGLYLALRIDGSVSKVNVQEVAQMNYSWKDGKDVWTRSDGEMTQVPNNPEFRAPYEVFPGEHWPPEWIVLPENPLLNWGMPF